MKRFTANNNTAIVNNDVYILSAYRTDKDEYANADRQAALIDALAERFGVDALTEGIGCYRYNNGEVATEESVLVAVPRDEVYTMLDDHFFIEQLARNFEQESMLLLTCDYSRKLTLKRRGVLYDLTQDIALAINIGTWQQVPSPKGHDCYTDIDGAYYVCMK